MPVYEVEVTKFASTTDVVTVQAADEDEARTVALEVSADWDYTTGDTQVESVNELSADEALDREVVRA